MPIELNDDRSRASLAKRIAIAQFATQCEQRGDAASLAKAAQARNHLRDQIDGDLELRKEPQPSDRDPTTDDEDDRASEAERARQAQAGLEQLKERVGGKKRRGRGGPTAGMLAPLTFPDEQLRGLHGQIQQRQPGRIEARAFNSASSLLPSQLYPTPTFPVHDNRILDWLPGFMLEAPSLEYIQVNSVSGAAAIVAEGAVKPELVMNTTRLIVAAQKIAAHTAISWESILDWPTFTASVNVELAQQIIDVENAEILNGNGTTGHLSGLLGTSGILTHNYAADIAGTTPTGLTALDAIEMSVAQLRVGSSKAEADLLILHPTCWSAIRRTKDSFGRYLVNPDPTSDEPETLWGINVLVTTQIANGTGVLLDTSKMGTVAVRQPLSTMVGYATDDIIRNLTRWVQEERLALCVERPSAVLALSNLPTS